MDITTNYQKESLDLIKLYTPIAYEMKELEKSITKKASSNVEIIEKASQYLIQGGGKRIRPVILIAIAKMLGAPTDQTVELASVVEFIHSATLLHDDVVDNSNTRRGRKTVNSLYGNDVSVLVGDFMYSRAFQTMADLQNTEVTKILSYATNTIAEGEILQLTNIGNLFLTRQDYLDTIFYKTAKLFEAASEIAAVIAVDDNKNADIRKYAAAFGTHLGFAFQLTDDALDYSAEPSNSGKVSCKDLQESKMTLPLLIALEKSSNAKEIRNAITNKDNDNKYIELVLKAIEETNSVDETLQLAKNEILTACKYLDKIPSDNSPESKKLLEKICSFVLERMF